MRIRRAIDGIREGARDRAVRVRKSSSDDMCQGHIASIFAKSCFFFCSLAFPLRFYADLTPSTQSMSTFGIFVVVAVFLSLICFAFVGVFIVVVINV